MPGYIVRSPVRWGSPSGEVVNLAPGDELPGDVSEEERNQLLAAGSVVPSDTYKAVEEADEKRKKLEEQRAKLEAESAALTTEEFEVQDAAERKLAEAQKAPEAPKSNPEAQAKAAAESKAEVDARQQQQKADTAGKPTPSQAQSKADAKK